jgi:zinc transporter ZupT
VTALCYSFQAKEISPGIIALPNCSKHVAPHGDILMTLQIQLLLFGLLAAGGNLLGGWLLTALPLANRVRLRALVALGAGFMLSAVFLDVLPEVVAQWSGRVSNAMAWVLVGYLLIQLVEHTIAPHFHFGEETHHEEMLQRGVAFTAVVALSIHAFLDGVAIASGLLTSFRLGIILSLAVLLHKVPEGFTVASIMFSAGRSQNAARIHLAAFGWRHYLRGGF